MGYFSELDIELQEAQENEFDWQAEQAADEIDESFYCGTVRVSPIDENEYLDGGYWEEKNSELGQLELAHIEALAEIQEYIHNGYGE